MAFEFTFPDVGEGIHEGEIVRWRVKVGDEVKEDQVLLEMETAKAIVELPSPKSGFILALVGKEGEVIKVGATLVAIGEKGETWEQGASKTAAGSVGGQEKNTAASSGPGVIGQIPTEEKGVVLPARRAESVLGGAAATAGGRVLPRLRKIAEELGVDISKIKGSGPGGKITEQDVRTASAMKSAGTENGKNVAEAVEISGPVERTAVKGIRKAVAEHMTKSMTHIPHVTHMDEVDISKLVALRESKKPEAEKRGVKLTYLAFIVKAVCDSLKKYPGLNAVFAEQGTGAEIIYRKYYNIGIAVDTPEGLMVPVIKNADQKDIWQIAAEIVDLAQKARERKITAEELRGGTFSITNIGSIGGDFATPIIAYGQSAILGVMKIKEKPVVVDGKIEARPVLSLALSFDHRICDGADAARFMNELMELLKGAAM